VVDPKTRKIEEVGEGVDYGVRRRTPSNDKKKEEEEEKFLKGVRICRECRPVMLCVSLPVAPLSCLFNPCNFLQKTTVSAGNHSSSDVHEAV